MSRRYVALRERGGSRSVVLFMLVVAAIAVGLVDAFNAYPWQSALVAVGLLVVGAWVVRAVHRANKAKAEAVAGPGRTGLPPSSTS
jgi:membrane protein implicated in regulation of membrane protease activity